MFSLQLWIGPDDSNDDDVVKFTESGSLVNAPLWIGRKPKHGSGDCVRLPANAGLSMQSCDAAQPFLCEAAPIVRVFIELKNSKIWTIPYKFTL